MEEELTTYQAETTRLGHNIILASAKMWRHHSQKSVHMHGKNNHHSSGSIASVWTSKYKGANSLSTISQSKMEDCQCGYNNNYWYKEGNEDETGAITYG
jgi:hypothetical protein